MASDEEAKLNSDDNFEWNVENEIRLFEAMIGHKPVGINKHFHMACISEKFESLVGKPVPSDVIWKHLGTMFDLAALEKKESLPFPNEQEEFSLPEADFLDLINEKLASKTEVLSEVKENTKDVKSTPKTVKESNAGKESSTKKERKAEPEESASSNDTDKKDAESENEGKRGKSNKEEKTVKTRGKRSIKDKKSEEETPQTTSGNKKEEETSSQSNGNKKEKQVVGKRNLRSRAEELLSNKSLTPPPVKRARRI